MIDGDQSLAELLETMKLGDLLLRFANRNGVGESFRKGLTGHSAGETELRFMAGVVRLGAMTGRLSAAPNDSGNGAGAQIAQAEDKKENFLMVTFMSCTRG